MSLAVFRFIIAITVSCFFFFSSRRRHTRFDCDWSSDVCSSDLGRGQKQKRRELPGQDPAHRLRRSGQQSRQPRAGRGAVGRSEERRVGKECRSRWWADHYENKEQFDTRTEDVTLAGTDTYGTYQ